MNLTRFTEILIQSVNNDCYIDSSFNDYKHHFSDHLFVYFVSFHIQKLSILTFKIQIEIQQYKNSFCMFHIKFSKNLLNVIILINFNEIVSLICHMNFKIF